MIEIKQKEPRVSAYLGSEMALDIAKEVRRTGRSKSFLVSYAWRKARGEIKTLPSIPNEDGTP